MGDGKAEDLGPNCETVVDCLQYAMKCIDKNDTASAKHAIKDSLGKLGLTQEAVDNPTKEILKLEYETLHKENWDRGQNVWLVNTILLTGSLLISFQSQIIGFPIPIVSLFLVTIAFLINATSDKVTQITYKEMERIRELLQMTGPTEMYLKEIRGKWWFRIRVNLPYSLYLGMASIYLFITLGNDWIVWTVLAAGVSVILFKELWCLVKRWDEKPWK